MKISAIVLCAGSATRSKLNINKVLYELDGTTVLEKSLSVFSRALVDEIIVATSEKDKLEIEKVASTYPNATVVLGGNTRTESVKLALKKVTGDIVLIHDGARPYITTELVKRLISDTVEFGSAITAIPSCDTLAIVENGNILSTVRDGYYQVQTPQAFFTKDIVYAYSQIDENQTFSDDSAVYSAIIKRSHITLGDRANIKLTYPEDFLTPTRVGVGWDLHTLVGGRKLILGGIEIPHDKGLLGHSDADVLTHAIMDALLSSLSLRDIGYHFPDTDPKYKGANSIELLKEVLKLIREKGYEVSNISACIMAEKPKLLKFIPQISTNLAKVINISTDRVGITATTMEKIGVVGREEGIAVSAFCQVKKAL